MTSADVATSLRALADEIGNIAARNPTTSSADFTSWRSRTQSVLTRALGADHHITQAVVKLHWTPQMYTLGDQSAFIGRFRRAAQEAQGYLQAAATEMETTDTPSPDVNTGVFDDTSVDAELWDFIAGDVAAEHWGKAATQAMLFVEDRIRRWTGQPPELVGENLMTAVFGDRGNYRLGLTSGEQQGWHRLAMGMSMALRNVVAHRIQTRDDHRRYTLGVVGVGSLLLTQLRYEHSKRFHDQLPVTLNQGETPGSPSPDADS